MSVDLPFLRGELQEQLFFLNGAACNGLYDALPTIRRIEAALKGNNPVELAAAYRDGRLWLNAVRELRKQRVPSFVPDDFQREILKALCGRALNKQELAKEVCGGEGSRLYNGKTRKGDLNELRDLGLVHHKRRLGFYRPDAPPPGAIPLPQSRPK